jgi:hypothetical protein
MTREEWHTAKCNAGTPYTHQKLTRNDGAEAVRRIEELVRLNYDAAVWCDIREGFVTDHRDVVAKAICEGKEIPAEVLADYPEMTSYVTGEYLELVKRSDEVKRILDDAHEARLRRHKR